MARHLLASLTMALTSEKHDDISERLEWVGRAMAILSAAPYAVRAEFLGSWMTLFEERALLRIQLEVDSA